MKDESQARQRAEDVLAEQESAFTAQAQAAQAAESKASELADAVSLWQVRRSGELVCVVSLQSQVKPHPSFSHLLACVAVASYSLPFPCE